jgi:hypothetical protein
MESLGGWVDGDMLNDSKYRMSFVTGALFLAESRRVAEVWRELSDWKQVRSEIFAQNTMQKRTAASQSRVFREIRPRLSTLTPIQLDLLISGDYQEQRQMTYLAICKLYDFVREFVIEVVREKSSLLDYQLAPADFDRFVEFRMDGHAELASLSEKSQAKARQVLFRILAESGCLESTRSLIVTPPIVGPSVVRATVADDWQLLKVFLMSDTDISHHRRENG